MKSDWAGGGEGAHIAAWAMQKKGTAGKDKMHILLPIELRIMVEWVVL